LRHKLGDQMHLEARAAKYRVAAHDRGIGEDEGAGAAQVAGRRSALG
jgi:hypothetical protein